MALERFDRDQLQIEKSQKRTNRNFATDFACRAQSGNEVIGIRDEESDDLRDDHQVRVSFKFPIGFLLYENQNLTWLVNNNNNSKDKSGDIDFNEFTEL